MGKRRKARELAMYVLFHLEFNGGDPNEALELIHRNFRHDEIMEPFSRDLVKGVCEHIKELDLLISRASKNWRIERMDRVDRCILRLSAFELLFMDDIPPRASIDEAVEMGKKYGNVDSRSFINGILDNIYNTLIQEGRIREKDNQEN